MWTIFVEVIIEFVTTLFLFLITTYVDSQFPNQGSNLYPLHWKAKSLTTGPPGKSLKLSQNKKIL